MDFMIWLVMSGSGLEVLLMGHPSGELSVEQAGMRSRFKDMCHFGQVWGRKKRGGMSVSAVAGG